MSICDKYKARLSDAWHEIKFLKLGRKIVYAHYVMEFNEESHPHLLVCEALTSTRVISSDKTIPVYQDIYVEDAARVEWIGQIFMEKYDLLKKLKNLPNPDAHSSMDINVIVIV